MKVIGLVGGSGTGKSTVGAHLASLGLGLIDADRIAHEIVARDPEVKRAIRALFGENVFSGGRVDRSKLGRVVFADPAALAALNALVHPRVLERCREMIGELEAKGVGLVVIDAALLLETDPPFDLDLVIALRAPREVQEERLAAKGRAATEDIRARLDSQSRLELSFDRADVVIDAARPLDEVLSEVERVILERFRFPLPESRPPDAGGR